MLNKDPSAQLDDEVNLCIGKAVIAITYAKAAKILNPEPEQNSKFTKTMNYINEKIEAFKAMALGEKIEIYKGQTASLAIKDLSLLLAYKISLNIRSLLMSS